MGSSARQKQVNVNRQTGPEATAHGGKRRLLVKMGHTSLGVKVMALCFALLLFSMIGLIARPITASADTSVAVLIPTTSPVLTNTSSSAQVDTSRQPYTLYNTGIACGTPTPTPIP